MKNFDSAQIEQLREISEYLYKERQERSISLEEVAVKTYIPLRLLQALEAGQLERLPEPVFVQGFIRRYADTLGLDGKAIAMQFSTSSPLALPKMPQLESRIPSKPTEAAPPPASQPASLGSKPMELKPMELEPVAPSTIEPIAPGPKLMPHPTKVLMQRSPRSKSYQPFILVGTAAVLLLGVAAIAAFNRSSQSPDSHTATRSNSSESQSPSAQPNNSAQPSTAQPETAAQATSTSDSPIKVAISLVGDSWLQVDADGKTEFEGILKKGEQRTWTAKKKLLLQSGNAGAVSVSYNQGKAKLMGAPGEVKDATFPPK